MGLAGHCIACVSTAREHASPTARRTSSMRDSATPLRRATAVATSLAVRTWAGSAVKVTSTVAISRHPKQQPRWLLLRLTVSDRLVYRVVNPEYLGQPSNAEDLQYPLLRADQVERSVMGSHSLQPADQDAEAGGVEELHLFHVHDELVMTVIHQVNKEFTETRRGIDIDLAFHVDDLVCRLLLEKKKKISLSDPIFRTHGINDQRNNATLSP